ncbi:cyclic nucleotide-binding-like protein [Obelidium mucronatum]|nr:cyclic nucleotide-binding-like protein [Obelidium mucronatum]
MLAHNGMCRKIGYHIENLGGIGSVMSRIIPICGLLIVFMHLQACSLYYVSSLQKFSTWNNQFDHWRNFEGGIEAANRSEAYTWMLIQAVGNMFAMNFKPQTIPEQVLNIIFIVCGGALYALLVGLLSSAVIAYDSSGRLYRQKLDELNEYMTWKRIDVPTKKKVLSYYEFKYRGKYFEEQNLLADMNGSLRMMGVIPSIFGKIAMALTAMYYITGDFVFHQGEIGAGMYFIHSGMVNIIVSGKQVATAKEGSFFGEVALIANIPRTASIQAACACTLYSLSAVDFTTIINEFEDMKERMELIYEERMERVKREAEAKKAIN